MWVGAVPVSPQHYNDWCHKILKGSGVTRSLGGHFFVTDFPVAHIYFFNVTKSQCQIKSKQYLHCKPFSCEAAALEVQMLSLSVRPQN